MRHRANKGSGFGWSRVWVLSVRFNYSFVAANKGI